jgi:hypothetical protein
MYALGMVRNTATGKWHPMFYRESPFPGGYDSDLNRNVTRFKSGGHHTEGFADRAAADAYVEDTRVRLTSDGEPCAPGLIADWEWDGEGMPLDVRLVSAVGTLPPLSVEIAGGLCGEGG